MSGPRPNLKASRNLSHSTTSPKIFRTVRSRHTLTSVAIRARILLAAACGAGAIPGLTAAVTPCLLQLKRQLDGVEIPFRLELYYSFLFLEWSVLLATLCWTVVAVFGFRGLRSPGAPGADLLTPAKGSPAAYVLTAVLLACLSILAILLSWFGFLTTAAIVCLYLFGLRRLSAIDQNRAAAGISIAGLVPGLIFLGAQLRNLVVA